MENLPYILRYEFSGIKNIVKPIKFEFYKKTIANDFDTRKYRIKSIYGENGTGKTATIYSLKLLRGLAYDEMYLSRGNMNQTFNDVINKKTNCATFDIEFYSDDYMYKYSLAIKKDDESFVVSREELQYKNITYSKYPYHPIFLVENGVINKEKTISSDGLIVEKTQNLLKTKTLLSSFFNMVMELHLDSKENNELYQHLINVLIFFIGKVRIYVADEDNYDLMNKKLSKMEFLIKKYSAGSATEELPKRELELAVGTLDFTTIPNETEAKKSWKEKIKRLENFIKLFKPTLKKIDVIFEDKSRNETQVELKMVYDDYSVAKKYESNGIKKLMKIFDYLDFACNGGISFIDEIDSNINDIYLNKILEYFMEYGKGQLCFTSHNLSPMRLLIRRKKSIDFITQINTVESWKNSGNYDPLNLYSSGYIKNIPYNIATIDFVGILETDNEE